MLTKISLILAATTALVSAAPKAAPQAAPLPEAFALAVANPADTASYECHYDCGYAIYGSRNCSTDASDSGPWDDDCLCGTDSLFNQYVPSCLDCGWCLWDDYGPYLTSALAECGSSTTPTGATCTATTTAA